MDGKEEPRKLETSKTSVSRNEDFVFVAVECKNETCSDKTLEIDIESKKQHRCQEEAAEAKHSPGVTLELVETPVLVKKEAVSQMIGLDEDASLSQSARLSTEAVYQDGSNVCTSLTNTDLQMTEVASDLKGSGADTVQNISESVCPSVYECEHNSEEALSAIEFVECEITTDVKEPPKNNRSRRKTYKCNHCEEIFHKKSDLKQHNNVQHSGMNQYKCNSCEKSFVYESHLQRHVLIHTGVKSYKCEICDKGFILKSNLQQHALCHSGTKPYKCDICKQRFLWKSNLKTHNILHHSGVKEHKCEMCEKSFICKSRLERHMLSHSGTKPYKCDKCEKLFMFTSHLRRHALWSHSNPKP